MYKKIFTSSAFILPIILLNSSHAVTCVKPRQCGPLESKSKYECADGYIRVSNFNYIEDANLINNSPKLGLDAALTSPVLNFFDGKVDYSSLKIGGFASAISYNVFGYNQVGTPSCDQFVSTIINKELFKINLTASIKGSNNRIIIKSDTISYKGGGFSPTLGGCVVFTNMRNDKGIYYDISVPLDYRDIKIEYIPLDSRIMNGDQIKFNGLNSEKYSFLEIRGFR